MCLMFKPGWTGGARKAVASRRSGGKVGEEPQNLADPHPSRQEGKGMEPHLDFGAFHSARTVERKHFNGYDHTEANLSPSLHSLNAEVIFIF